MEIIKLLENTLKRHNNGEISQSLFDDYVKLENTFPAIMKKISEEKEILKNKLESIKKEPTTNNTSNINKNPNSQKKFRLNPGETIKYKCDQTKENVIITFFVYGLEKKEIRQTTDYKTFTPEFDLDFGRTYTVDISLQDRVENKKTTFEIQEDSVIFTLVKSTAEMWDKVEYVNLDEIKENKINYPTSKKNSKLEKLTYVNQKEELRKAITIKDNDYSELYAYASQEERRAMEKSYYESGGTRLDMSSKAFERDAEYYKKERQN